MLLNNYPRSLNYSVKIAVMVFTLLSISLVSGRYWTKKQYEDFAETLLPLHQLEDSTSGHSSFELEEKRQIFLLQLEQHTSSVAAENSWQIYQNCQLVLHENNRNMGLLDLRFLLLESDARFTDFHIGCRLKTSTWLLSSGVAGMLIILLWIIAPRPLNQQSLQLFELLKQNANCLLTQIEIKKVLLRFSTKENISSYRLYYLRSRLGKEAIATPKALEQLLKDTVAPLVLKFSIENDEVQVSLSGLSIVIASTPAIYWLWYANYRKQKISEGWVSNPPSNRPDESLAHELILLMKQYGGHARALKELEQHGLRAKTLDKNRNRIKEALNNHLPKELAELCGFETMKRTDATQSAYRIKIEPECLNVAIQTASA